MSEYFAHQPWALACSTSASSPARVCSSMTPYRVSRSATSRGLKLTRPCSRRLILDREARISYPARSGVIPASSRRRRSWVPRSMRSTVGPPRASAVRASVSGGPPVPPDGGPSESTVLNPGSGSGGSALVWSRPVRGVVASRRHQRIARIAGRLVRRGAPAQYTGSGGPWRALSTAVPAPFRYGHPAIGEEQLLSWRNQVVELSVLHAAQEPGQFCPGVDEGSASLVPRVTDGDHSVRQFGQLHTASARVAGAALAPACRTQEVGTHAVLDVHLRSGFSFQRGKSGADTQVRPCCS